MTTGRLILPAAVLGVAAVVGLAAIPASGATASETPSPAVAPAACSATGYAYATGTVATEYTAGCNVRARIDRYITTYPTQFLGPWDTLYSDVWSSSGVNAGNYYRFGPSGWIRI